MSECWKRWLVLALMGAGAVVSGCSENESSIYIRSVLAPNSNCLYVADPASEMLGSGTMDIGLTYEYKASLLVGNQLVGRGSSESLRTETSTFIAEGMEVRVERANASKDILSEYTVSVTGVSDASTGSSPGWGIVDTVAVNSAASQAILSIFENAESNVGLLRVVSVMRVWGKTLGGREVESGEFRFPIAVCIGCLPFVPPDAVDSAGPSCIIGTGSYATPCRFGQDEPVDCRLCLGLKYPASICIP